MGSESACCSRSRRKFYDGLIKGLVDYANSRFFWGSRQSDGASAQEHIEIAKKNCFASQVITDKTFEDVPDEVECPFEVEYLWVWFRELDSTRANNGMGISPINHLEITAWSDGMALSPLMPFERQAIRAVDDAYVIYSNSKAKDKNG
jgi:hypothetical protein